MIQEPQERAQDRWADREMHDACAGCGADVIADPVDGGLHCARCGQWHALCAGCMPAVPENSRDAAWVCPECRS